MDKLLSPFGNASSQTHGPGRVKKHGFPRRLIDRHQTPINRHPPDTKSDVSEHILHLRQIENTYKTEPDSEKRFQHYKVENLMQDVLKEFLNDVEYSHVLGQRMSKLLTDTIKTRVKEFRWDRYKFVVHVIIGENKEQDIRAASRFLWNEKTDSYASTTFSTRSLFALAVCYAVYTD